MEKSLYVSNEHAKGPCELPSILHLTEFDPFVKGGYSKDILSLVLILSQKNCQFFQTLRMIIVLIYEIFSLYFH